MKRSLGIVLLIFVMIVVLRLAGITYGYYVANIVSNTNSHSVSVESKYLAVEYLDGTSVMNFNGDYLFPGDSAEKTFTIKNTGVDTATYNILIDNVVNEFERTQDLRYVLYINDEEVNSGAINNNSVQYLYANREITAGTSDSIRFVFEYATTDEIQNADMNKTISFRFNIDSNIVNSTEGTSSATLLANHINNYRIYGNSIQDGTPSIDTPVDVQSVGDLVTDETSEYYGKYEIPIVARSKNLFNMNASVVSNKCTVEKDSNSLIVSPNLTTGTVFAVYELNLKPNTQYTISYNSKFLNSDLYPDDGIIPGIWVRTSSSGGSVIKRNDNSISDTEEYTSFTFNSGTYETVYLWLYYHSSASSGISKNSDAKWIISNLQVEKSASATDYEPYIEPITTSIYLDEPLRKIGESVDYIDFKKQKVVRKIKEVVLDGTESWGSSVALTNTNMYQVVVDATKIDDNVYEQCLTNRFEYVNGLYSVDKVGCAIFKTVNGAYIRIRINASTASTVVDFKSWLASNNITLLYILKEDDPHSIKLPTILTDSGTNIIEIGTSVAPNNIEIESYYS